MGWTGFPGHLSPVKRGLAVSLYGSDLGQMTIFLGVVGAVADGK
jgi:hypothetical protein